MEESEPEKESHVRFYTTEKILFKIICTPSEGQLKSISNRFPSFLYVFV